MKKTLTMHLAGMVYHIEEDAFHILKDYINDIKRVFYSQEGLDEMVDDIEARIAELFQERLHQNKEVVTLADVEEIISIMGSPSQFDEEGEQNNQQQHIHHVYTEQHQGKGPKKLYRDTDQGVIAGVSAGLAHYFGMDPIIIRVLWVILVLIGGSGLLIYIIAWMAIPEAKTTAQKLHMKGQPANIDNMKAFADALKNEAKTGFDRASNSIKNSINQSNNVLISILKLTSKIIGFGMLIGGILGTIGFLVFILTDIGTVNINDATIRTNIKSAFGLVFENNILAMWSVFLAVIIPLIFFIIVGDLLAFNKKRRLKSLVLILLISWFAAIISLAFLGAKTGFEFQDSYTYNEKNVLQGNFSTISVNLFENDILITDEIADDFDGYFSFSNDEVKLGHVEIELLPTKDSVFYYDIVKSSYGANVKMAKQYVDEIHYKVYQEDEVLNIPTLYSFSQTNKIRGQKIRLLIYVPVGKQIILNGNLEDYPIKVKMNSRFSSDFVEQSSIWVAGHESIKFKGFVADN